MVKQDYLIRMIQEVISLIANLLLNKKKLRQQEWIEYGGLIKQLLGFPAEQLMRMNMQELIDHYQDAPDHLEKIELAAVTLLKMSDETESNIVQKSKLRQDGIALLKYVQQESHTFSIQRLQLIELLEANQ